MIASIEPFYSMRILTDSNVMLGLPNYNTSVNSNSRINCWGQGQSRVKLEPVKSLLQFGVSTCSVFRIYNNFGSPPCSMAVSLHNHEVFFISTKWWMSLLSFVLHDSHKRTSQVERNAMCLRKHPRGSLPPLQIPQV